MTTLTKQQALYAIISSNYGFNVQIEDEQEYQLEFSVTKRDMVLVLPANLSDEFEFETEEALMSYVLTEFKRMKAQSAS